MKENEIQEEFEMFVELLTEKFELEAAELAAGMSSSTIADFMSRYSVDRRECDTPSEFLLEAVGMEAQKRLRAIRDRELKAVREEKDE